MAKNKRPQDRQEKQDEIVAAARPLFLAQGFEATSMSRLAAAAGIAPNTIYWYFKDKDDVLAAVLNDVFKQEWQLYLEAAPDQPIDKLLWLFVRLKEMTTLISTVHARLLISPAINAWHDNFHHMIQALLRHELLKEGIEEGDLDSLTAVLMFTIEGLLVHQYTEQASSQVCATLIRRLKVASV